MKNLNHLLNKLEYKNGIHHFNGNAKQAQYEINEVLMDIKDQEKRLEKLKFQAKMVKLAIQETK